MKTTNLKTVYPIIGALCAAGGTYALLSRNLSVGMLPLWGILLLAANIFIAAGTVCGMREETVEMPNPKARFSDEEPATIKTTLHRTPATSLILAIVATVFVAYYTGSALDSLLTLFTWGGFGYPLARNILRKRTFGESMQSGLLSASVLTILAGVIHVFKVTPDHSFRIQYAFDLAVNAIRERILPVLQEAKQILEGQSLGDSELTQELATFSPEMLTDWFVEEMLFFLPAFFAILVLLCLCLTWWLCKQLLKKDPTVRTHQMGRLDTFSPSRILFGVYMISYLVYLIGDEGSAMMALGINVNMVASAVLAFAGYSLVLFIINTRASSKAVRVVLSVLTLLLGMDSCGYQLLTLAGLFSSDSLRQNLGGGTFK